MWTCVYTGIFSNIHGPARLDFHWADCCLLPHVAVTPQLGLHDPVRVPAPKLKNTDVTNVLRNCRCYRVWWSYHWLAVGRGIGALQCMVSPPVGWVARSICHWAKLMSLGCWNKKQVVPFYVGELAIGVPVTWEKPCNQSRLYKMWHFHTYHKHLGGHGEEQLTFGQMALWRGPSENHCSCRMLVAGWPISSFRLGGRCLYCDLIWEYHLGCWQKFNAG